MRKIFRTVAIIALMGMAAASCQKETIVESWNVVSNQAVKTVCYTIDGVTRPASFTDDASWNEFLDWLVTQAEEGHRVSFHGDNYKQSAMKETVTYTTSDHDDAVKWANKMEKDGYAVAIDYDKSTGLYTCVAIK